METALPGKGNATMGFGTSGRIVDIQAAGTAGEGDDSIESAAVLRIGNPEVQVGDWRDRPSRAGRPVSRWFASPSTTTSAMRAAVVGSA